MIGTLTAIVIALLLGAVTAMGQDCATAIDRAEAYYNDGNLHAVIETLDRCLKAGMPSDEQWRAYRLIVLARIFLDEPEAADTALDRMLAINPRYEANPGRDPVEFRRILGRYGSFPRILVGPVVGLNHTWRRVTEAHTVAGAPTRWDQHPFVLGSDVGAMIDLNLTPSIALSAQAAYSSRQLKLSKRDLLTIDEMYTEHLTYLSVPFVFKYRLGEGTIQPCVWAGYFIDLLFSAASDMEATPARSTADTESTAGQADRAYSDFEIRSTRERRNSMNHGIVGGIGVVWRIGDRAIVVNAACSFGLSQIVRPEMRFADQDLLYRYFYIDDDFRLRGLSISVGYMFQLGYTVFHR